MLKPYHYSVSRAGGSIFGRSAVAVSRLIVPLALIPLGILAIHVLRGEPANPTEVRASAPERTAATLAPPTVKPEANPTTDADQATAAATPSGAPSPADDAIATWFDENVRQSTGESRWLQRGKESTAASRQKSPTASPVSGWSGLRAIWPLGVVLTVIVALAAFMRKWMPRMGRVGGGGAIDILARRPLSGKQSLCLVRVGNRVVLVGVSPERINPVAEIRDAEEIAQVLTSVERGRPTSFTNMFARLTERDLPAPVSETSDQPTRVVAQPSSVIGEARDDSMLPASQLAEVGAGVRGLLQHVRGLTDQGSKASAEPTA